MKNKLLLMLFVLSLFILLSGCYRYPRLRYLHQEIENPAGYYALSDPRYCIIEEQYIFEPGPEDKEIRIPFFHENEHQQLWSTEFVPAPDEQITRNGKSWGRWILPSKSPEMKIDVTGKGYLLQKNVFYPRERDPSGQAFLSYIEGESTWDQLRRQIMLSGDSFDAMKFAFVTLMTEKRGLSLTESYEYLAGMAEENHLRYIYPAGYFIRRGNLVPWVWFAFKGPGEEWWYIDLENARRENSYFYFGNITSHYVVRNYLSNYSRDYELPKTFPPSDKHKVEIVRFRQPHGKK